MASKSWWSSDDYIEHSPLFPNPVTCIKDMAITGTEELYQRLPWNGLGAWLTETKEWIVASAYIDTGVLFYPILFAVLFTILREFLNKALFRRIPKWVDMAEEPSGKFPESMWKFSVYTVTWIWAIWLITFGEHNYFFDLKSHWENWHPGIPISRGIHWLYMVQMGFYLHCAYATIYLETIRRDFVVLMLHHLLTLGLLMFSYIVRFHMIGLLVLFFQDIGDIWLELSKTVLYFKDRGGKEHWGPEMGANFCFGVFTLQHILFRLYWYPTKAIYSAQHVSVKIYPNGPFYLLFVPMLWALYAMQVYWFKFILRLLWRILVMGEQVNDNREYKDKTTDNGTQAPSDKKRE